MSKEGERFHPQDERPLPVSLLSDLPLYFFVSGVHEPFPLSNPSKPLVLQDLVETQDYLTSISLFL